LHSPDQEMAVKTSNLAVPLKDGNSTIPEYFGNMTGLGLSENNRKKSHDSSANDTDNATATNMTLESNMQQDATTFADLLEEFVGGADEDFDEPKKDDPVRSRQHEDLHSNGEDLQSPCSYASFAHSCRCSLDAISKLF